MKILDNKGFTLVEMLACVVILLIVMSGVTMRSSMSTYNSFNERDVEETLSSCANLVRLSALSNNYADDPKLVLVELDDAYYLDIYLDGVNPTTRSFLTASNTYVVASVKTIAFDTKGVPTSNPVWTIGQQTYSFNQVTGVVEWT
ncbi:MAG: prepilin-type N-terminal cleavage/methylation domain-containing protein [Clostridia bacterium]